MNLDKIANIASGLAQNAIGSANSAPAPPQVVEARKEPDVIIAETICSEFKKLFTENKELYTGAVKDAITDYFQNPEMIRNLNNAFSNAITSYMKDQQFQQVAKEEISKVLGEIMKDKLDKGLENKDQYVEVCKEILKKKGGKRTKSRRKPRKKTIKHRN